jgi:hypothetical protein
MRPPNLRPTQTVIPTRATPFTILQSARWLSVIYFAVARWLVIGFLMRGLGIDFGVGGHVPSQLLSTCCASAALKSEHPLVTWWCAQNPSEFVLVTIRFTMFLSTTVAHSNHLRVSMSLHRECTCAITLQAFSSFAPIHATLCHTSQLTTLALACSPQATVTTAQSIWFKLPAFAPSLWSFKSSC